MRIHLISTIFFKEVIDAVRDYKSLATAFIMPAIFAITLYGMISYISSIQNQSETFNIAVIHADSAPDLIAHLKESGIQITPLAQPLKSVIELDHALVLEIPEDFNEQLQTYNTLVLTLYSDHANTQLQSQQLRVQQALHSWSVALGSLRLLARNVHPEVIQPLRIELVNTSNPQKLSSRILAGVPLIFVMIIFASGMGIANEMAAGERERHTLESLLAAPSSRTEVYFGKFLAACALTFFVASIGVAMILLSVLQAPLAQLGMSIKLNLNTYIAIIMSLLPIVILASSLQLFVSFYSRSFKDSQAYNNLLMLLPTIPGIYISLHSVPITLEKVWIPIMGTQMIVFDLISDEEIAEVFYLLSWITPLLLSGVIAYFTIRRLHQERVYR